MTKLFEFDRALVRKYDKPGPRYTSYPTAPQFESGFNEALLREHIKRSTFPTASAPASIAAAIASSPAISSRAARTSIISCEKSS
jgi:oxygen-independent coproporphyrinogen-3 oxidase